MSDITVNGIVINPTRSVKFDGWEDKFLEYGVSEKLDGVRAIWTGEHFISRNGKVFQAPSHIIELMKNTCGKAVLDGELHLGRGGFDEVSGVVRQNDNDWDSVRYSTFDMLFDSAGNDITNKNFEDRQKIMIDCVGVFELVGDRSCYTKGGVFCTVLHQQRYLTASEFEARMCRIVDGAGGEGLIIRNMSAPYEMKLSKNVLKYKRSFTDEATIVGYANGAGKYEGMLGAYLVECGDVSFKVGSGLKDADRDLSKKLPIGTIITYGYFEKNKTSGVPRFPTFVSVRDYE